MYYIIISIVIILSFIVFYFFISNKPLNDKIQDNNQSKEKTLENLSKTEEKPLNQNIKLLIFTKDGCNACMYYKTNIHEKLSEDLKKTFENIDIQLINNPTNDLMRNFNITFVPSFVVEKNEKMDKLNMDKIPNFENISSLINSL